MQFKSIESIYLISLNTSFLPYPITVAASSQTLLCLYSIIQEIMLLIMNLKSTRVFKALYENSNRVVTRWPSTCVIRVIWLFGTPTFNLNKNRLYSNLRIDPVKIRLTVNWTSYFTECIMPCKTFKRHPRCHYLKQFCLGLSNAYIWQLGVPQITSSMSYLFR